MQKHIPVLFDEVLDALAVQSGGVFVDGTVGCAGHAQAILKKTGPDGCVIGIDRDQEALAIAKEQLRAVEGTSHCVWGNYSEIKSVLDQMNISAVDGILVDLGVSSLQLDEGERGFSFMKDAALDMRMNRSEGPSAANLVSQLSEQELANTIYQYGDERRSRRIAKLVVETRRRHPIETTTELADLVVRAYGRRGKIHPATRTFQALRIAVNQELDHLDRFLTDSLFCLKPRGRLCVISYHSLEDRRVKVQFREWSKQGLCQLLTKKPIVPSVEEIKHNKRSRSAKMRVCERLELEDC